MTIGDFLKDLIDDAADSVERLRREGEHLRELRARADFGLRVLGTAAKTEIEASFDRIAGRLHEISQAKDRTKP